MKPDFIVKAGEKDLTAEFKKRLVSLAVVDADGLTADSLTITLDNSDHGLAFPDTGTDLQCWLGYEGALNYMGQYSVDNIELPLELDLLSITATGARFRSSYRQKRDGGFSDTNVKAIIETVAHRNGFEPSVADAVADLTVGHFQQKNMSDSALMVELKKQFGVMVKPVGDRLVAVPDGEGKTVSGKTLPVVEVALSDIAAGSVNLTGRNQYTAVSAKYQDFDKASTNIITEGDSSKKVKVLSKLFANEEEARGAVKAKLAQITRKHFVLKVARMAGNTNVRVKRVVAFKGHYSDKVNGEWDIDSARHTLNSQGLITVWSGKAPKKRPSHYL